VIRPRRAGTARAGVPCAALADGSDAPGPVLIGTGVLRTSRALAALLALLLLLVACTGAEEDDPDRAADGSEAGEAGDAADGDGAEGEEAPSEAGDRGPDDVDPAEQGTWTYLSYSMADTNLEAPMLQDVVEMASVGSGDGLNVVALVDRAEGETDAELGDIGDWTTAKVLHVQPDALEELADLGEIDMADPAELTAFIEFAVTSFPADHYALTISDHGGGWTGIGPDDSSGQVMDLAELEVGIADGLAAAGIERFDLLGFDACLMATYEVASTLAPYADYLLASEELEPGHGWNYAALSTVRDDPATDAATLGSAFVDGFAGQADEQGTGAEITLSLLDLSQIPALDEAMATFAGQLAEQVDALGPLIGQQREAGIDFARSPDPANSPQLTDLGVFVAEIGIESLQVSDAADGVLRAIGDTVVAQTVGPARLGATGMSIYFPATPDLIDPAYAATTQLAEWQQFLGAYHGAGQAIPEEEQPTLVDAEPAAEGELVQGDATVTEVEGGVEVSIQLDPATLQNVASASLSFGYVDPEDGAIVQLGDTEAEVLEDGTVVGFTDLTVLTITDAVGDTIDAYLTLEFDEEAELAVATVPLDYTDPASGETAPVDLSIVLDPATGDVLQEVYYLIDEESGSYGELQADPEGLIQPVVLVFAPDGTVEWQGYGDVALFADLPELQYDIAPLEAGTEIYVDIVVTDFGGNSVIGSATFLQE
jgi:hypothetical protein